MPETTQTYLTLDEAATISRLSRETLMNRAKAGKLRILRPSPGRLLVRAEDLERFLLANEVAAEG
jgi:excisionase family DNA binding protein